MKRRYWFFQIIRVGVLVILSGVILPSMLIFRVSSLSFAITSFEVQPRLIDRLDRPKAGIALTH